MLRWLLSEGHHHDGDGGEHDGDEGGADGAMSFLLYNCAAMFLGAFFVGMMPLMMDLGEGRLKVLSIFSAGLMVWALLIFFLLYHKNLDEACVVLTTATPHSRTTPTRVSVTRSTLLDTPLISRCACVRVCSFHFVPFPRRTHPSSPPHTHHILSPHFIFTTTSE